MERLVISIIAFFTGIASASASIAQTLFFIFLVVFVATLIAHLMTGRAPPTPE